MKKLFSLILALTFFIGIVYGKSSYNYVGMTLGTNGYFVNGSGYFIWGIQGTTNGSYPAVTLYFSINQTEGNTNGYFDYTGSGYYGPYPKKYNTFYTGTSYSSNTGKLLNNDTYFCGLTISSGNTLKMVSGDVYISFGSGNVIYVTIVDAVLSDGSLLNATIGTPYMSYSWTADVIKNQVKGSPTSSTDVWMVQMSKGKGLTTSNLPIQQWQFATPKGGYNYGNVYCAKPGTYTVKTGTSTSNYNSYSGNGLVNNSTYITMWYINNLTTGYRPNSGYVIVERGQNSRPYIFMPEMNSTAGEFSSTLGDPLNKYYLDVSSSNSTYGTIGLSGTYYDNQSNASSLTVKTYHGDVINLSATNKTGYHFTKWQKDGADYSESTSISITMSAYASYVANFTVNTYNVVFNGNGSTGGSMSNQSHTYGQSKNLTTNAFTRTGYTFIGWATSADRANAGTVDYTDGQSVSNLTTTNNGTYNLYAVWEMNETVTFTIADYTNGTVTVTPNDGSGAFTSGSRDLAVGTIVTLNFAAAEHYHISYVTLKGSQFTNGTAYTLQSGDGMVTLTADFLPDTYDITFKNADGTTLKKSDETTDAVYSVAYGETPAYDGATPTKAADSEYTYTFNAWTPAIATVTTDATYTATYSTTKVQYTLTWDFAGGATTSETGDYTNGLIDWGTDITAPANPTKVGFTFTGWNVTPAATMPTNDVTYTAQWESSVTPEIVLNEEGGQHTLGGVATNKTLDDLASDYASRDVNVTIDRTLYGGSWNTIVFPFSVEDMEGNVLDGSLYELNTSTTTATSEGMVINFEPLSGDGKIVAGVPYLIRTSADVNLNIYPFNGVRLTSEFSSVTDGDAVDFVPIKEKEKINYDAANLAIFIVGNRLYYPNKTTGTNLRGFRAYLRIKNGTYYGGPVRIRIADTGETITLDEEHEIETRKYVEDGILIIERGGVRYDAQGKRMDK